MAETVRTSRQSHIVRLTLNSDGQSHKALNAATIFTLITGLAAFVLGIVIVNTAKPGPGIAIPAGVTGLVSLVVGLYTQMMSATREQRVLIVTGIIAGFVGLAMGLAHGAFG